jgi:hypothetical protein
MAYLNHVWLSICGDRPVPPGFSIRVFTYYSHQYNRPSLLGAEIRRDRQVRIAVR